MIAARDSRSWVGDQRFQRGGHIGVARRLAAGQRTGIPAQKRQMLDYGLCEVDNDKPSPCNGYPKANRLERHPAKIVPKTVPGPGTNGTGCALVTDWTRGPCAFADHWNVAMGDGTKMSAQDSKHSTAGAGMDNAGSSRRDGQASRTTARPRCGWARSPSPHRPATARHVRRRRQAKAYPRISPTCPPAQRTR